MKAVVALTKPEREQLNETFTELQEQTKGYDRYELFMNFQRITGYAHYTFSGEITEKLVTLLGRKPTCDEIIMLVDNGFSHFGASCSINGARFSGRVNTD